jgi:hypothetical protein
MEIREFSTDDVAAVRELFIRVNRLLAPADMKDAFEIYVARSLTEEIDRVSDYYSERKGGFWVAVDDQKDPWHVRTRAIERWGNGTAPNVRRP